MEEIRKEYKDFKFKGMFVEDLSKVLRISEDRIYNNLAKNGKFADKDLNKVKQCIEVHKNFERKLLEMRVNDWAVLV